VSDASLTVGLPVFNGERFLRPALDSILGQTHGDFTLVASDNASSDATVEILEEYAGRDRRIVLLRSDTNRGAAWNYNRVFAECRSTYFKWAAADDMLAPTCLERSLALLEASPAGVVLAYPRTQVIDEAGTVVGEIHDNLASAPGAPPHARFRKVIANVVYGNVIFAVMRSDALRKTRLHGSFPSADYVMLAELALVGEFREIPEPLFLRRLHDETSMSANPTPEMLTQWLDPHRRVVRRRTLSLLSQHVRAIHHVRLSPGERAQAYAAIATTWARRQARLRTRFRHLVGRRQEG
jgi:glycosyltransferase involved in cell wall biosynthesis